MRANKATYIFLFWAITLSYSACKPAGNKAADNDFPIRVTDFRGKEVALAQPASRIVCLIESGLSGLHMLQAENQIVGVSSAVYNESSAPYYAALDDRIKNKLLPAPGNWDFVSIESLVALQPDLVIIWSSQTESIQSIEAHGIAVYGVFLKSFSDVYKEIEDLGILTGREDRADHLISYTKNEIAKIDNRSATDNRKRVYFMWQRGLLETAGTSSTVNELIELAGAKNSCTVAQEQVTINKERLIDWNPDVIAMWFNPAKNPEDILNLSELQYVKAIQNRQVYEFPSVFLFDLWTLKFPYAVKMLAQWCYPDDYDYLDLEEEKQKMLVALYGEKGKKLTEYE